MIDTKTLREKYAMRPYGSRGQYRYPAGGEDVLALCHLVDDLLEVVRWAQRGLPEEQQQEIEKKLWLAWRGR